MVKLELTVKVEGTSRWIRMADKIWTVRSGKGQQSWLAMKMLKFQHPSIPCCVVCSKSVAEGVFIEHASGNSRGKGTQKKGRIGMRLMHHSDWRCIRTGTVGFVLKKYYESVSW